MTPIPTGDQRGKFGVAFANFAPFLHARFPAKRIVSARTAGQRAQLELRRISKIGAADLSLLVQKGNASEEVLLPFNEINEVQIKHKDS